MELYIIGWKIIWEKERSLGPNNKVRLIGIISFSPSPVFPRFVFFIIIKVDNTVFIACSSANKKRAPPGLPREHGGNSAGRRKLHSRSISTREFSSYTP